MFAKIKEKKNREKEMLVKKMADEKREKEMRVKMSINKTLNRMTTQSKQLDGFKKEYIDKARQATLIGNQQAYNFAKAGLKMCLSKQNYLDAMILNFQIALQTNEMNKIINEFVKGIGLISDDMKEITSTIDISRVQSAYETAVANSEGQYEALDAFLKEAESSVNACTMTGTNISDDEVDKLINSQAVNETDTMNDEIDARINKLKMDLGGTL